MEKSRTMLFVIIGLLVLLLGAVVATAIYLITAFGSDSVVDDDPFVGGTQIVTRLPLDQIEFIAIPSVRSNLQEPPPGFARFILADPLVGFHTAGDTREVNQFRTTHNTPERISVMRSIIGDIFFQTTYAEASTPEGRRAIEERILAELQVQISPLIVQLRFEEWTVAS